MLTLPHLLQNTVQAYGRRRAIIDPAGELSWNEYLERVARTAGLLRGLGLAPGHRFATLCRNSVRHAQLLLAGFWAGVVPAPLNFRLAPAELDAMLEDAGCGAIMADEEFAPLFERAPLSRWRDRVVLVAAAPASGALPAMDALLEASPRLAAHESRENDVALLLYTGGTTGRGKGVRLTHRNIVANALQLARVMAPGPDDVYLHVSPMFHSTDLKATVVTMFGGGHVYLNEFSPRSVLEAIERNGVTIASLVPTMIVGILKEADPRSHDLSRLRLISYGTAPMDEQWLRKAMASFGHVGFHQCYGLTETSPYLAILDEAGHRLGLDARPDLLRSAGRLLPGTMVRFVDDEGRDAAPGEPGEILVGGPQVADGYHNRPQENATAFRDGWLHTGDVGRLDQDGYLHILDRKKDMVITGGENVYTREVEAVLQRFPGIADAAVLGVPDAKYGEALLAAIVPAGAPPAPEDIIRFCRDHLGGYKIPRRFMFVEAFPRSPLGKIRKHELRDIYLASGPA
ncbi:Long-chain-fatty-acid--CoA ligase [Pigmentiphaga humi]|uniref:Long-chain-fatty-acid--CoA ligase n=1 Tax=Pigmentiphaga humi TaxID=2478468 RepID=A0A3P4AZL0_9BURK|nr:AMP-binding protein [Pigmentiphaga humi]VCU68920.1 Long-chain-fatty-acid--CoA ligase [Pigmentiphaga humi]